MAKRSTIGTNPLDVVIPNPLEATMPDQHEGPKNSIHREGENPGSGDSSANERSSATLALQTTDAPAQTPLFFKGGGPPEQPTIHQEDIDQSGQPEHDVLSLSNQVGERLTELEQENLCLKWALGLILVPLALLALLG